MQSPESESFSVLDSVCADASDQKEGKFVMNGPLSELAADQSIPMSRRSALPVVGNLPITAVARRRGTQFSVACNTYVAVQ